MDLNILNLIPDLSKSTGIPQGTLLFLIFVLFTAANRIARIIPDDATGWKGVVRMVAAVIGAYTPTRITSGVSVTDAAKAVLKVPPIPEIVAAEKVEDLTPEQKAILAVAEAEAQRAIGSIRKQP